MIGKMKVQNFIEPLVMHFEEHDIPQITDDEVLIRVKNVGICGSDLSYYFGHSPLNTPNGKGPLYLGHEASGVVMEVGSIPKSLELLSNGDRVVINPVQQCNACPECMRGEFNVCQNMVIKGVSVNGCFAEYVKVKYTHVYKMPDEITFEEGALMEPLACATYGIKNLDVQLGQTVVVFGTGTIGLMQLQLAKAAGAGKVIVIGIDDFGLKIAKEIGAYEAINSLDASSPYYVADISEKIKELNSGVMAPRAIVATSAMTALQQVLTVTGAHSTIVYFGLPGPNDELKVPVLEAIQYDRTLRFSFLAPLVWDNVFNVIVSGQVNLKPLITHKFSLKEAEEGIKFMKDGKEGKIKGIVFV